MRAVSVQCRLPCRERTYLLAPPLHNSSTCVPLRLELAYSRPACLAVRRKRSKCTVARSCAVAAPQRHHALYKSELGYRTDFAEQYSLLEIIGKGNFGTVWLAASRHDPSQHVAVKVVSKLRHDRTHEESLACIKREVALWGSLSGESRFVVQLLGLYEDSSSVYLVQQLCRGGDLGDVIKDGAVPESCCAAMVWCVLSAIRDCHDHNLALIDVKPQNFLMTTPPTSGAKGGSPVTQLRLTDQVAGAGPCVVACDFGCSVSYSDLMRGAKRAGSPVFFAPEQFTTSYGLGVDVWAAGVMLYVMLSGRYPFWDCKRGDMDTKLPAYQVMLAICSSPISFSGPEWHGISREARNLVGLMLDRHPGTRITAEQALQHPWFARCLRTEAAAGQATAGVKATATKLEGRSGASRRVAQRQGQRAEDRTQLGLGTDVKGSAVVAEVASAVVVQSATDGVTHVEAAASGAAAAACSVSLGGPCHCCCGAASNASNNIVALHVTVSYASTSSSCNCDCGMAGQAGGYLLDAGEVSAASGDESNACSGTFRP